MTERGLLKLLDQHFWPPVHVTGGDYSYDGWLIAVFRKREFKGDHEPKVRCVVEDACHRLFIHNPKQVKPR